MKHVAWEPCLACHEPVHPVAGRCKHCKADLVALRAEAAATQKRAAAEARAAAATPLRIASVETTAPIARPRAADPTRKLMIAAAAVLLVGIGGGVVAQKLYARDATPAPKVRQVAGAPVGSPSKPDPAPDPDDWNLHRRGFSDPVPADPFDLFRQLIPTDPMDPGFTPPRTRPQPKVGTKLPDVSDVQLFLPAMVDVLCQKLTDCGLFDGAAIGMCKMMAMGLQDDDTVDRVRQGQCKYDADAARECLSAVGGMTCDNAADPQGMLDMLALTDRIVSCSRTLDCR
jgi:hypothetical protein